MERDYSHIKFEDLKFRDEYLNKVMNSVQEEKYRGPVPGYGMTYPEENWVEMIVVQKSKNIKLNTYRYPAEGKRKAVFILFHGLNSHVNRSAHIAQAASKSGIETVSFDFRGFGKSEGIRGWVESEEQHFKDSDQFAKLVEAAYPGEKIFIGGQSWGGQTAYKMSLNQPERFAGVVLYAPAIKDNKKNSPFSKSIVRFVGCLFPSLPTVCNEQQRHGFSNKNPAVSEGFTTDPLIYQGKIIPGTIRVVLNCSDFLENTFKLYKAPFLVLQAGIDKLVDPLLGFDLMKDSPSTDKEHIFYETSWHNMWGEDEIFEAIKENIRWILQRC